MTWYKNSLLQSVLTGLCLGIGFVVPSLWILGLFGIGGILYITYTESSWKKAALAGCIAWTIKMLLTLSWFWTVYPIEWLPVDFGNLEVVLIFFWWLSASVWLGFGGVVFVLVSKMLLRYSGTLAFFLLTPVIWVLSEMFGSLLFSGITIGPGGIITTAMSMGYVGYLVAQHELLLQLAQLGGVYVLGVCLVGLAAGVVWISIYAQTYRLYAMLFMLVLYGTSFADIDHPIEVVGESYTVAVIDTNFTLSELRSEEGRAVIATRLESAMQAALALDPDYIILPEDSRYFNQANEVRAEQALFSFRTQAPEVVIVDSGRTNADEKAVLQSFVYNGIEQTVDQSHKRYLVPQGEFMPSLYATMLRVLGKGQIVDQVSQVLSFSVGSNKSQEQYSTTSPGILFCFESVDPNGVRKILQERDVPFVAHPVSHVWFHEPSVMWQQLDTMLRVQAVWNQVYIVSAGSYTDGRVVAPSGSVIAPEVVSTGDYWTLGVTQIPVQ